MWRKLSKFIEKIQHSNEANKKRWLIISSAIAIIVVIGLWMLFIDWTILSADNNFKKEESELKFWGIFKNGLKIISESFWNSIKNVFLKITSERTIVIE